MIHLQDVSVVYPTGTQALDNVTLDVAEGEFVFLVGPSGSGKTTMMKLMTGELRPTSGTVQINGFDIAAVKRRNLPKLRRTLGVIFQDFRLIDNKSIYDNVAFAMHVVGASVADIKQRVPYVLELVGLEGREKRLPQELSGGEQQRVAIARALVKMPKVLLLDEPLSNLDARLRLQTREELRRIQCETKITTVFVTHDQEEAMSISDMIIVMKEGVIQQIGKPQEVYDNPANLFVAKFLGTPPINVFRGQVKDHTIYIGKDAILKAGNVPDQEVWVGVRPEGFILNENGALHCNLSRIEVMGRDVSVVSTKEESENATIRSIISAENSVDTGSLVVSFDLKPNKVFLFHKDTQERIPYTGS